MVRTRHDAIHSERNSDTVLNTYFLRRYYSRTKTDGKDNPQPMDAKTRMRLTEPRRRRSPEDSHSA